MLESVSELKKSYMLVASEVNQTSREVAEYAWRESIPAVVLPRIIRMNNNKKLTSVIQKSFILGRKCHGQTHENEPLGTTFFIGKSSEIKKILPIKAEMNISQINIVESEYDLSSIFHIVDGNSLAFDISENGKLTCARILKVKSNSTHGLSDSMFYSELTKNNHVTCVRAPKNSKSIQIFENGKLLCDEFYVQKNDLWVFRILSEIMERVVYELKSKKIPVPSFEKLLTHAIDISHSGHGAMFVLGDSTNVLKRSSSILSFANSKITVKKSHINKITTSELISYASADGAVIIDEKLTLHAIGMKINPECSTLFLDGHGTRHNAALNITAECNALAIVISHDGLISIMGNGKLIMSF